MNISVESVLGEDATERLLDVYRDAFAPLVEHSAVRQVLTDDEFRAEMAEDSVLKIVAWDEHGAPAGLAFASTDLTLMPWINPHYYRARFPDQYERRAIFYFGGLLVDPRHQGGPWVRGLIDEFTRTVVRNRGIAAFDCCRYNRDVVRFPELVAAMSGAICHVETLEIDSQHYYAYVSHGFREDVLDLVEEELREAESASPADVGA